MFFPPVDLDIGVTKSTMKTSGWRSSLLGVDLWCDASFLRGFQMPPASKVRVPRISGKVPVASGAKHVDRGVLEFCGVSAPPQMRRVGMDILADQSAALAEFDQMILSAIWGLTRPSSQQRWTSVDHFAVETVAGKDQRKDRHVNLIFDAWIYEVPLDYG